MSDNGCIMEKIKRVFISALLVWLVLSTSAVFILNINNKTGRAVVGMGIGLILLWIFLAGGLMYLLREPITIFVQNVKLHWAIKFIIFSTLLACAEEAITTTMTNLAPLFGVKVGDVGALKSYSFFAKWSRQTIFVIPTIKQIIDEKNLLIEIENMPEGSNLLWISGTDTKDLVDGKEFTLNIVYFIKKNQALSNYKWKQDGIIS